MNKYQGGHRSGSRSTRTVKVATSALLAAAAGATAVAALAPGLASAAEPTKHPAVSVTSSTSLASLQLSVTDVLGQPVGAATEVDEVRADHTLSEAEMTALSAGASVTGTRTQVIVTNPSSSWTFGEGTIFKTNLDIRSRVFHIAGMKIWLVCEQKVAGGPMVCTATPLG